MNPASTIRTAEYSDQQAIRGLLDEEKLHRHLEWREPLNWVGHTPFLVLERDGEIHGVLACPPDPPGVAWVRLFVVRGTDDEREIWKELWDAAATILATNPGHIAAALAMTNWMAPLLEKSGFSIRQELVLLERESDGNGISSVGKHAVMIRAMATSDLERVSVVDSAAFYPLWQNTLNDLDRAHSRAFAATVAETDGLVIGYQISTRTGKGIHLARLAVLPEFHGQGIGQALVEDLVSQSEKRGIRHISVNTQSDNATSLALYTKTGFFETGERFPVYTWQMNA